MFKTTLATVLGALTLAAAAHAAPAAGTVVTASSGVMSPSAAMQIEMVPRGHYHVAPDEFTFLRGTYALSNGATLSVTQSGSKFYAEVDGVAKTEVMPVAENVFVAKDDKLRMAFQPDPSGFVTNVTVRYTVAAN